MPTYNENKNIQNILDKAVELRNSRKTSSKEAAEVATTKDRKITQEEHIKKINSSSYLPSNYEVAAHTMLKICQTENITLEKVGEKYNIEPIDTRSVNNNNTEKYLQYIEDAKNSNKITLFPVSDGKNITTVAIVPNSNSQHGADVIYINPNAGSSSNTGKEFAEGIAKQINPDVKVKDLSFSTNEFNSGVETALNSAAIVQSYNHGEDITIGNLKSVRKKPYFINTKSELNGLLDQYETTNWKPETEGIDKDMYKHHDPSKYTDEAIGQRKQEFIKNHDVASINSPTGTMDVSNAVKKIDPLIDNLVKETINNQQVSYKTVDKFYRDVFAVVGLDNNSKDVINETKPNEHLKNLNEEVFSTTALLNKKIPKLETREKILFGLNNVLGDTKLGRYFKSKIDKDNLKKMAEFRKGIIESLGPARVFRANIKGARTKVVTKPLTDLYTRLSNNNNSRDNTTTEKPKKNYENWLKHRGGPAR